jgi:hypothetical protein
MLVDSNPGTGTAAQPSLEQFLAIQQQMFYLMQQQISGQYHQMLEVMARLFETLHHDQIGVIREEFDRLRQVTEELQSLSAEALPSPPPLALGETSLPGQPSPPPASELPAEPPLDKTAASKPHPEAQHPEEIHTWIHSRIGELQRERQSLWDHIVELVAGR